MTEAKHDFRLRRCDTEHSLECTIDSMRRRHRFTFRWKIADANEPTNDNERIPTIVPFDETNFGQPESGGRDFSLEVIHTSPLKCKKK